MILTNYIDDPQTFASQPVCIQLVGRPFQDEEIAAVAEVVDAIINE
jgi:amidase